MSRIHELDMPKLVVTLLLALVGLGVGVMAWLSMPEETTFAVKALLGVFVFACFGPLLSVIFNWRAGLALSVVVALSALIALQLVVKKPVMPLSGASDVVQPTDMK
jgi:hypothetical protein